LVLANIETKFNMALLSSSKYYTCVYVENLCIVQKNSQLVGSCKQNFNNPK